MDALIFIGIWLLLIVVLLGIIVGGIATYVGFDEDEPGLLAKGLLGVITGVLFIIACFMFFPPWSLTRSVIDDPDDTVAECVATPQPCVCDCHISNEPITPEKEK